MEANSEVKPTRRRRHSAAFKAQAVAACMQPGVSIAAVALHYRLNANLLRRWVAAQEELDAAEQARASMIVPTANSFRCSWIRAMPLHRRISSSKCGAVQP